MYNRHMPAAIANGLFLERLPSVLCEPTPDFCRFVEFVTPFVRLREGRERGMKGKQLCRRRLCRGD